VEFGRKDDAGAVRCLRIYGPDRLAKG
jgi:hypothetical protein